MLRYWLSARIVALIASILLVVRGRLLIQQNSLSLYPYPLSRYPVGNTSIPIDLPFIFAILLVFLLIEIAASAMIRIANGYWPAWLQPFERIEVERKAQRYHRLSDEIRNVTDRLRKLAQYPQENGERGIEEFRRERRVLGRRRDRLLIKLLSYYPSQDLIMPTKLGNTLRASEQRVSQRYGMDVGVVYPRLVGLLSKKKRRKAETAYAALDMWTRLAVTFLILAFIIVISLRILGGPIAISPSVAAVIVVSLILTSAGCYQESVRSALEFGRQIEVVFDLHRIDLLRAMNLPVPKDIDEQRKLFSVLSGILQGNSVHDFSFHYESGGSAAEKERREVTRITNQYNVEQAAAVGERAFTRSRKVKFVSGIPVSSRYIASATRKKHNS